MRILAFGEVMMRLVVPRKMTIAQGNTLEYMYTGTGVNILGALIKMGHEGRLLSKVSSDSIGEGALAHLRGLSIDTDFITRGTGFTGMYFLEEGFGLRSSKVTYNDRKNSLFSTSSFSDYNINGALDSVDAIHICGISIAMNGNLRESLYKILDAAKSKGIKIVFDFNYRPSMWEEKVDAKKHYERMLSYSDVIFATEMDARYILGMDGQFKDREQEIEVLLKKVAQKYDLDLVAGTIRTRSSIEDQTLKGFVQTKTRVVFSKDYKLSVYDRIGGGDGYAAGIIHSYLEGYTLEKAVEYATISGVLAHTNYGDTPVSTSHDIEEILEGNVRELKR